MDRTRQLEILVRAAELGSFAAAAKSLGITPSAISRSIAELERSLKTPVFNRTTRQLQLTDEGRRLVERAGDILSRLADLEDAMAPVHARTAGTVRIGIPPAISRHIVMPRLAAFCERYPDIRLEIKSTQDPRSLQLENLDLLFHVASVLPDSRIVAIHLGYGRPAVYASAAYLSRHPAPQRPDDLRHHRCLVFKPPWLTRERDTWSFSFGDKKAIVRVQAAVMSEDRESLLAAAIHGTGVVYLACFDPQLIGPGGLIRLLPDWEGDDRTSIHLIHRRTARLPARVRVVADFCRQAFREFDPGERTVIHRS